MARADSAHAPVRLGEVQGLAYTATQSAVLRLARRETWVRRAVPATVAEGCHWPPTGGPATPVRG